MPVYTIKLQDGRTAKIQAADDKTALAEANRIPPLKGEKADYQRTLTNARKGYEGLRKRDEGGASRGILPAIGTNMPILPLGDELVGGVRAWENTLDNIPRRLKGKPTVSSRAVYEANRDAANEYQSETRRLHPVSSFGGGILGGLVVGGLGGAGKGALTGSAEGLTGMARVLPRLKAVGTAAGVGGAGGVLYGLGEGRTVGERLKNAAVAGPVGALTGGLLEGAVIPAVGAGLRKAGQAFNDVTRGLRKPTAEAEAARGTRSAIEILQRKGLTPETVRAAAGRYAPGLAPSAAEMAGADVERTVGAVARRQGTTGDAALALKEQRMGGSGDRVLNAAEEHLGVRPEFARGDIEAAVKRGRDDADPLYAAMRDVKAGITTPELEAILKRGHVQDVLRTMEKYSDTAGKEPYGLAWGDVDVPAKPVGPDDLSFAATGAPDSMEVPPGPDTPPSQGPSLLTAMRQSGNGITEDLASEASDQGLRLGARKGGAEANDMAIFAQEGGFTGRPLTEAEMEEKLLNGQAGKMFAREADLDEQLRYERRQAAKEFNARGGNPEDLPHPEDYGNVGPAPERPLTEPARTRALTQDSWDKLLSGIDNMIKRDGAGKPIMDDEIGFKNRALLQAAEDARAELFGNVKTGKPNLAPEMRAARDVSGDYQGIKSAFNRMKGKLNTKEFSELQRIWKGAKTDAERNAMRGAIANDIHELVQAGQLKAGRFKTPRVKAKLDLLFGRKEAAGFVNRIEQEADMAARANRMAPTSGSGTYGWGEAGEETNKLLGLEDVQRIGGKLANGKWAQAAMDAVVTPLRAGYRYGKTAGSSEESRNAMGRVLLMGPDELIPLLREFENLPPPVQAAVRERAVTLGLVGAQVGGSGVAGDRPDR